MDKGNYFWQISTTICSDKNGSDTRPDLPRIHQIEEKKMLPEIQKNAYEAFYDSTANNQIINEKVTTMIQLATSLALGCYP